MRFDLDFLSAFVWALCLSPIWGTLVWCLWEGSIKPRLIPHIEIIKAVEKLYADHSENAFEMACTNEHRAWYDCDSFEQGRWRRIREEIMRRERAKGYSFAKVRR